MTPLFPAPRQGGEQLVILTKEELAVKAFATKVLQRAGECKTQGSSAMVAMAFLVEAAANGKVQWSEGTSDVDRPTAGDV